MTRDEFRKYIESIGFKKKYIYYEYKNFRISLWHDNYYFQIDPARFIPNPYDDLNLINKYFKKEIRSIKLKKILG